MEKYTKFMIYNCAEWALDSLLNGLYSKPPSYLERNSTFVLITMSVDKVTRLVRQSGIERMDPSDPELSSRTERLKKSCCSACQPTCLMCWIVLSFIRLRYWKVSQGHNFVQLDRWGNWCDIPLLPIDALRDEMNRHTEWRSILEQQQAQSVPSDLAAARPVPPAVAGPSGPPSAGPSTRAAPPVAGPSRPAPAGPSTRIPRSS
ncbi:hypothetical protein DACRYDRAFT_112036 [Dacryopinax primogenitus]|uniref:Uncharacterized protein n=1 Tax=Dacryopinax primogenitus (strain DJM 731) TaxID=1858805 RepID=M5FQN6_DACPD|nr:uncharacterized protein DACRYDRAFT_112036 [Dacryopinax primogenitus]EJT97074.1 hypothetical protein DACRYDRAFT_112036 [Dacryopinax primogenitus]